MRGHPCENNVITCYPDTYTPVNTLPLNAVLRTAAQTSQAYSRMRVHIYNLGVGVNRHLFPLNPFNSERVCIFY